MSCVVDLEEKKKRKKKTNKGEKQKGGGGGGGVADGEMRLELVKGGSLGTVPQNLPPSSE